MAGDGKAYGLTTGLSRGQFIVALFDGQKENKFDDETLAEYLTSEFPKSGVQYSRYIRLYRNKYNRGDFANQLEAPAVICPRYSQSGKAINPGNLPGPKPREAGEEPEKRTEDN